MNRREFTKSLAALGLAPALPMVPTAAAATPAYTPYMYGLGAHLARTSGTCSPDILVQKLRLAPDAARAMHAQLIRTGVLGAPGAAGISAAAQPYMRGTVIRSAGASTLAKAAKTFLRETLTIEVEPDENANH